MDEEREEHLTNGYDPELAQSLVAKVEKIDGEQESAKGSYMNQCRQFAAARKAVYSEAKDQGVSVKSLKATVKKRKLLRKIDKIPDSMEDDERQDFEQFQAAMGDTPLGAWAVNAQQARRAAALDGLSAS
jgi:hypothetical protein